MRFERGQRLIFVSACLAMRRFLDQKKGKVRLVDDVGKYTKHAGLIEKLCEWDKLQYVRMDRHVAVVQQAFEWLALARNVVRGGQSPSHPRLDGPADRCRAGLGRSGIGDRRQFAAGPSHLGLGAAGGIVRLLASAETSPHN